MPTKLDGQRYDTDKLHGYMEIYEPLLQPWVERELTLLELGVRTGGSLRLWRDYFPRGRIVGLDLQSVTVDDPEGRISVYQGDQADTALLSRIAADVAPHGFDIIIDDASHLAEPTRTSFWHLFDHHLKPGGLYVVEDWGTGYWESWPDGRAYSPRPPWRTALLEWCRRWGPLRSIASDTHVHGMVGFVKELVDEQGIAEATRGRLGGQSARLSRFERVVVTSRLVAVTKAGAAPNPG